MDRRACRVLQEIRERLRYAEKHMENVKRMEKPTDEKCERCGSPLVIKWGKHGSFFACSAYDKTIPNSCTFTKENPIDLPDLDSADAAGDDAGRILRELRTPHGAQARTFRPVHGVHRISGMQDDAPARPGEEGSRHSARRKVSAVRAQPDAAARTLWRVHLVQRISRLQMGEAELYRGEVPGVQGRRARREEGARAATSSMAARVIPKCEFTSAYKPVARSVRSAGTSIWSLSTPRTAR